VALAQFTRAVAWRVVYHGDLVAVNYKILWRRR